MKQWLKDAVFYEIYPQSFYDTNGDGIGDFPGIIAKLDYIKDLGCNALWINPCYDSPFKDAGYDVRDYKKIAPRYGTNADAAALFKAAHEKGIHVLFDLVPGHTSEEHAWFKANCRPERQRILRPLHLDRFLLCLRRRHALHRRRDPAQRYLHFELLQVPARAELRLRQDQPTLAKAHHRPRLPGLPWRP